MGLAGGATWRSTEREAALEDALAVLGRHARTVVGYPDLRPRAVAQQPELDAPAGRGEADGIVQHRLDGGLDQLLAAENDEAVGSLHLEGDAAALGQAA